MHIDILKPGEMTADMMERWSALQQACPRLDSPFLSPHWARAVERAEGAGSAVRVARLSEGGAEGFFSARLDARTARPAGAPMCDYQGVVAAPALGISPRRLVEALGVDRLDFDHMLADQAAFASHGRGECKSWMVDISCGYEAYAATRRESGVGIIKDLDKKRRKAEREAGAAQFTAFSRSRTDFEQLLAWKRRQHQETGQTDVLGAAWTRRLVNELFESRDPAWGGVLFTLHLGDKLAAAHFHLRGGKVIHGWLIGHDPAVERYSPGLLLFHDILKWMDHTPYNRLDLGAGDYRFKRELSNGQIGLRYGYVGRPSPSVLLREAAYQLRHAAEALPLGQFSQLPGKAMRRMDILRALKAG